MLLSAARMLLALPAAFLSGMVKLPEAGVIGGLLLAAGLALWLLRVRCLECGAHLLNFPGEYCKHCGNRLDWDEPPRF